ncbi:unnamed protein product [Clavelina lepadiformis]|uniref:Leprecan-like alpha-helical domain-containing protein n=1 Tax=Clavelina lepadiformis TaxID=159417 RepID=A0ABP0GC80_CLALP
MQKHGPVFSAFQVPNDIALPLETLADEGVNSYNSGNWRGAINYLEKALINYRMSQHIQSACGAQCKVADISKDVGMNFDGNPDLKYVGDLLAEAYCIKLCKEEHPFGMTNLDPPKQEVIDEFETRKIYDYLQFAYFQENQIKKASQAAQTFYNFNLNDEHAMDNLNYYKSLPELNSTSAFKDLEAPQFHELFLEGVKSYEKGNHEVAVNTIERTLENYFREFNDCESLCFQPVEQTNFYRFYKAMAQQLIAKLECSLKCEQKISPVIEGEKLQNFIARCFSYLQFSYHKLGDWGMAIPAAASALLLDPESEIADSNMKYFREQGEKLGYDSPLTYNPRSDALKYHEHVSMLSELVAKGQWIINHEDEDYVQEDLNVDGDIFSTITDKIVKKIEERLTKEITI